MRSLICAVALTLSVLPVLAQEHGYSAADIETGARLYLSSCAGCHGQSGDGLPGVDLSRGQFRRAMSDPELIVIIRSGIAGTTMPPSGFSTDQAATIVAYLRNMRPAPPPGTPTSGGTADLARGRALFQGKGDCGTCHRVNGIGPRVAPDLSEVGAVRTAPELERKLVDPNGLVRAGNRYVEVTTNDGTAISGRLLNHDTFSIQLIDANERLRSLPKSTLREVRFIRTSPMPSYRDKLTADEVRDLVSYLISLKGIRP
jgi:putative heme-binding domain-containing protein